MVYRRRPGFNPGAADKARNHPNDCLSGDHYGRTPPGADCISFHDPLAQTDVTRPPADELTAENTDQVVGKVRDGTLLLFRAWRPHSVDNDAGCQERVAARTRPVAIGQMHYQPKPTGGRDEHV